MRLNALCERKLLCLRLIIFSAPCNLCDAPLKNLDIRENKLQIYRFNIPQRIDASVHMDNIGVLKAPYNMDNRIHLADVGKKLVSKSFSL